MQGSKRYTNQTWTKRVDHEAGRHHTARAVPEPAVCKICGDVYADRRWSAPDPERQSARHPAFRPAQEVVCPACERQQTGEPGGFVYLDGAFLLAHRDEIEHLLRNETTRAEEDNPLARIMDWQWDNTDRLTVTTTTEHLAQRLGHALKKAFDGEVLYDFSHENKLARVSWHRD
ncbi:MAG: BCAM0308 family protein [Blastocatellia bacterium]